MRLCHYMHMDVEAGSAEMLDLLCGQGKTFSRLDIVLTGKFQRTITRLLRAEGLGCA